MFQAAVFLTLIFRKVVYRRVRGFQMWWDILLSLSSKLIAKSVDERILKKLEAKI